MGVVVCNLGWLFVSCGVVVVLLFFYIGFVMCSFGVKDFGCFVLVLGVV